MTIKSLSPVTRQRAEDLFAYLASAFPGSSLDETFESVDTDAVFIGVKRREKGWLFVGVSGPAMVRARHARLSEIAESLHLADALDRASQDERVWIDVEGPTGYALRVTDKDDHAPGRGAPRP